MEDRSVLLPGDQPLLGPELVTEGLGAFDELNFLGRGTFGETYHAIRGDDVYAIKVIHYPDMPEHLWERELAALERVDHPNIVGFRRSGRFTARGSTYPYLECDFINGGTVRHRIDADEQPTDPSELRTFLTGLLAGVGEIHDLGILHRDIKPENIALREGDWGSPVLLDFGLARVLDMSSHTDYPALVGTTPYMAPEQLRLQPARRRSDLFAIGVVAYEAGTGRHPFRTPAITSPQSLHDKIQNVLPDDPGASPAFDNALTAVVLRLMSFREYERLGIGEALRDLEGVDET